MYTDDRYLDIAKMEVFLHLRVDMCGCLTRKFKHDQRFITIFTVSIYDVTSLLTGSRIMYLYFSASIVQACRS